MTRRVFEVTMTIAADAGDMERVRQEAIAKLPEMAELTDEEIDASNVNGVICGALHGLSQAGGEQTPDLADGASGAVMAETNAGAKVLTVYTVKELKR